LTRGSRVANDEPLCGVRRNFVAGCDGRERPYDRRFESDQQYVADRLDVNKAKVPYGIGYQISPVRGVAEPRALRGMGRPRFSGFVEYDPGRPGCYRCQRCPRSVAAPPRTRPIE
jgi:hypothetical protein